MSQNPSPAETANTSWRPASDLDVLQLQKGLQLAATHLNIPDGIIASPSLLDGSAIQIAQAVIGVAHTVHDADFNPHNRTRGDVGVPGFSIVDVGLVRRLWIELIPDANGGSPYVGVTVWFRFTKNDCTHADRMMETTAAELHNAFAGKPYSFLCVRGGSDWQFSDTTAAFQTYWNSVLEHKAPDGSNLYHIGGLKH